MTSFGGNEVNTGNFVSTFKIQGQVYHRIGSLMPEPHQSPSFLQIYFVGDEDKENEIRCSYLSGLKQELVGQLQKMLHEHNKYIKDFKATIESVPKNQNEFRVVINADRKPSGEHRGRFNAPTSNEVALMIVGQTFKKRDIVLHSRESKLVRISEIHRAYDTLQYPLIFCHGPDGYCINSPRRDPITKVPLKKTVSALDFYIYKLMEQRREQNYLVTKLPLLHQGFLLLFLTEARLLTLPLNCLSV
jgi:hypothetical protein